MVKINIANTAGTGLIMSPDDALQFATNVPAASDYEKVSSTVLSTDPENPNYMDVVATLSTGIDAPFQDVEAYYDYDPETTEYHLTGLVFSNADGVTTLTLTDLYTPATEAEVNAETIDFGDFFEGRDVIHGGKFDDVLYGQQRGDVLYGHRGNDEIHGGAGSDMLAGGYGADTLFGGTGDDLLKGQVGRDTLYGGGSNDILRGGWGQDTLYGGAGYDYLYGGPGADTFVFFSGDGVAEIYRFRDGRDHVQIESGAESFDDVEITQDHADAVATFDDVTIIFLDTDASVLGADDFIF
ncbi:calcium-binding protein [Tropicimonas isoalkanivorans]|uniref:Hemolysin-type calcium-binding repeat-containing protein n=1 Tax=Tropicimonas isoalkanivorans TaxID=441112 RepID=A0A1I1DWK2_9RHOB|nr:calcium-binding protein [Tropicimonas isoalkanivorans]SFB79174.1 Hemolysin-type calcium-binding repeat-containing protein [Tropicimonas isoalkanivorans]